MGSNEGSDPSGVWTNEKHVNFLNSMEASFVRTMFENSGLVLRLDRHMPDSSESTLDLKTQRRRRKHLSSDVLDPRIRDDSRTDKKTRTPSPPSSSSSSSSSPSQPYDSSQDQVVPQLENRRGDKDVRDHSAVTPAH